MPRPVSRLLLWFWCAVLLLALCINACGDSSKEIVARVAGRVVTKSSIEHWLAVQGGTGALALLGHATLRTGGLKQHVLESLISAEWTVVEAEGLSVSVSNAEAAKQLSVLDYAGHAGFAGKQLLPAEAELRRSLSYKGLSHADRVWLVKLALLASAIVQKKRASAEREVIHAQIVKYYEEHRRRFIVRTTRDYLFVVTYTRPAALKARRELEAGKDFASVSRRRSIDPPQFYGVQHLRRGESLPELVEHVFAAKPHMLIGPSRLGSVYDVFEVTKIRPTRRRSLREVEGVIRHELVAVARLSNAARLAEARASTWKARTSCSASYIVPLCSESADAP
jgi:hypothetical protein